MCKFRSRLSSQNFKLRTSTSKNTPALRKTSYAAGPLSPIISIYPRPFLAFLPFLVPPGAASKSSMLLAVLKPVPGRLGGALGGPLPPPLENVLMRTGGAARFEDDGTDVDTGADSSDCVYLWARSFVEAAGRGANERPGGGGVPDGLLPMPPGGPLNVRRGPLGGGGVADGAGVASAPPFLSTQRFRSGSYTKLLASPSLALMGLFACGTSGASFFAPPNHPPNQPFLGDLGPFF